ncbi:MAG: HD-GYP domain-containing protein [Treponema sp.]|jgi:HD-GYP domain-containing protein (c-di-GMP phosphodiesterase class II)|nr:HD-GYP domain-containing protein [Treponema sp.]
MNDPAEKKLKEIPVNILKPGMIFTEPVYIDDDNFLVPPGIAIKQKDLARLTTWGIPSVMTKGGLAKTPEAATTTAEKQKHIRNFGKDGGTAPESAGGSESPCLGPEKDANESGNNEEIRENNGGYRNYIALIQRLDGVFSHVSAGAALNALVINELTDRLLNAIRGERGRFVGYILGGKIEGRETAKSSVNSAILSAMIAQELSLPPYKVAQVITGALLHDIGMLRLPKEILSKRGGLSQEEVRVVHIHPLYAYRIIQKELNYPDSVGFVALQHHERWDGQGYPSGIAGEHIDIGARILAVADSFEAMVSKKPYRNSMVGYEAMKALMSDNQSRFDPAVLKAFIAIMGIYPIGSIVVLNDGAAARVVEVQSGTPLRPTVQILVNSSGQKEQNGAVINLMVEKKYFISRALDPRELADKHA